MDALPDQPAKRRVWSPLAIWRTVATGILLLGIVAAVLTTPDGLDGSPAPAHGAQAPEHLQHLGGSMGAWLEATPKQQADYVAWLVESGLDARRAAILAAIDWDAEVRAQVSGARLAIIFLLFAGGSLLLVLLPLFVSRRRAPRRVSLWGHAIFAALTLAVTFVVVGFGLEALMAVTSGVTRSANPERSLVEAAFLEIEEDARELLEAGNGMQGDALPYGPVVGVGGEGDRVVEGGFLANLLENLSYFDPDVFVPAVIWTQRTWQALRYLPLIVPFLVALVFLLTIRHTLLHLVEMPLRASRGEPGSGRRALREASTFVGRELLAILLLILVLVAVSFIVQLGARHLSRTLVTLAFAEARTTVEYFGRLTVEPDQAALTLGILALPAYLLVATIFAGAALGLFALRARRLLQERFHRGQPLRRPGRPWRRTILGLVRLQWIPVLLLWALQSTLEALHAPPFGDAADALGRLTETGTGLLLALPAALLLFGGLQAARDLAGWLFARPVAAPRAEV